MASLLDLVRVHEDVTELLMRHRDLVVGLDFAGAVPALDAFAAALRAHMEDEETLLLPLYAARVPPVRGADADALRAEHRSLLRELGEVAAAVRTLAGKAGAGRRDAQLLLDREGLLLHLLDHHDRRERATLYPLLEAALSAGERDQLMSRLRHAPA